MSIDGATPPELDDVDTRPVNMVSMILVVDDVPANLVAAEAALAPLGRLVVTARSGEEALTQLLERDFALALIDVNMPLMDGFELAHLIRSRERSQLLPIIFMTASTPDKHLVARAYELGAVDFLYRPVIPEVLRAKASVFVTLREQAEQLAVERMEHAFEKRRQHYETAALRRARDREHATNQQLAEDDRRKDGFIAILAHELRNPLAPLRTCIDLIREDPTQPLTPRMIDALDRQTSVLQRLVDDLLDVSRIKADKIELRPEQVDIGEVIEAAVATSRAAIEARKHTLSVETGTKRIAVVVDTVRISQVLSNVLNNAARYTDHGGRIDVTVEATADNAIIRVRDNGMGIPPALQHSMFSMFVQERVRSDGSGGLGLGLALARRLVEMHNGTIHAHSDGVGRGSTFAITLPRAGTAKALAPRKRTGDMEPLRKPSEPRLVRTVVVDDNEDARELLSMLLRARGYEVLTAHDGPTGLALIREQQPDVALVDLGLPQLDGFGVIEALRRDNPSLKTRLIALTGYGQSSDHERTKQAGFHAHLVKPASAATIFDTVTKQLDDE